MIGHCDPARGGSSRSLRSASGGEAKGGNGESCKEFADGVMLEVGCWKLEVGCWSFRSYLVLVRRTPSEGFGSCINERR